MYECKNCFFPLGKCSAAVLEQLGKTYKDDLPPVLLRDSFKDKFRQGDWEDKEAVILAQGLISECCMKGMETARPNLVPWLVSRLWNEMAGSVTVPALLRSSTCWTIGRYAHLVVGQSDTLSTVIDALLKMMLEKDKRVQAAACAALALIEVQLIFSHALFIYFANFFFFNI